MCKFLIIIFIILIILKLSREFGDIGKAAGVKFALETPSYMFVFKNSAAEQNRNFETRRFFSEIFIIARQSFQIIYDGGGKKGE